MQSADKDKQTQFYLQLIKTVDKLRNEWNQDYSKKKIEHDNLQIKTLNSFANQVLKITVNPHKNTTQQKQQSQASKQNQYLGQYLLKFYRPIFKQFTSVQVQNYMVNLLSTLNLYPKVFYSDHKCRLQRFFTGQIPTIQKITSEQLRCIVQKLAHLPNIYYKSIKAKIEISLEQLCENSLSSLYPKFQIISVGCKQAHPDQFKVIQEMVNEVLSQKVRKSLDQIFENIPLVPSHNDCHLSNVLVSEKQLILLDYQFFGLSYRGYDLGNFFNECATDYITFQIKEQLELKKETQKQLIQLYYKQTDKNGKIEESIKQVENGRMLSHLFWLFIGVRQLCDPKLELDMKYYVRRRYEQFMKYLKKYSDYN